MSMLSKYKVEWITLLFILLGNLSFILSISNYQISDAQTYQALAEESVQLKEFYPHASNLHDGYIWPSFYINSLTALYSVFGTSTTVGKVFNILLLLVQFIALKTIIEMLFGKERRNVYFLSFFFLLYPTLHLTNLLTLTEPLFVTLAMLSWLFFLKIIVDRKRNLIFPVLSGLFIGCAILTRPVALPVLFLMLLFFLYGENRLRTIMTFLITIVLAVGAYGLNVKQKLGTFNATGTTGGLNLLIGNNPYSTGKYQSKATNYVQSKVHNMKKAQLTAFQIDALLKKQALEYMAQNPLRTIEVTLRRVFWLFLYDGKQIEAAFNRSSFIQGFSLKGIIDKFQKGPVSILILVNQLVYGALMFFALCGVYFLLKARKYKTFLLTVFVPFSFFLVTIAVYGGARYHFPIVVSSFPVIIFGSAQVIGKLQNYVGGKNDRG